MTCPLREIVRKYLTVYYLQKIFGKNIRGKNAENDLIIDSHGNVVPFTAAC